MEAYEATGVHPYHYAIVLVLDEGSPRRRARSPTRSAMTAASSSVSSTNSRSGGSSSASATRTTGAVISSG